MGLDFVVNDRGGETVFASRMSSYSGFHEFRTAWANLLGFHLDAMEGYGGDRPWDRQPLRSFFDHSDCDGTLSWRNAQVVLEQAKRDAPKLPEFAWQFQALIDACEHAVKLKTPLIFC